MSKSLSITIECGGRGKHAMRAAVQQVRDALADSRSFDHGFRGPILDDEGHTIGHYAVQGADDLGKR